MKPQVRSLRLRLIILLLLPLSLFAIAAGYWRYQNAIDTAERLYDKTLLAVTLAVSRHVVSNGGDVLAESVLEILTEFLGDQVFYKVSGPKGLILTGYAFGPSPPPDKKVKSGRPLFFDGDYQGEPIRAAIYREFADVGEFKGWVSVKVWQTTRERRAFARQLALQSILIMLSIIGAATIIIWFGVNRGLRPLLDLEEAVTKRSADDLSPIRRAVPREVRGLVGSMNTLFEQLREAFAAQDSLIANAAHQLRNPIAAVLSQAEAAARMTDPLEAQARVANVAEAARRTSRLTNQLLSMEKARGRGHRSRFDLVGLVAEIASHRAPDAMRLGGEFEFDGPAEPIYIVGDPTTIGEAVENLIDNAVRYGFDPEGTIKVSAGLSGKTEAVVVVEDDGPGIADADRNRIFDRFVRLNEDSSDGCGLGLAIVWEVAAAHNGAVSLNNTPNTKFSLSLPISLAA